MMIFICSKQLKWFSRCLCYTVIVLTLMAWLPDVVAQ